MCDDGLVSMIAVVSLTIPESGLFSDLLSDVKMIRVFKGKFK